MPIKIEEIPFSPVLLLSKNKIKNRKIYKSTLIQTYNYCRSIIIDWSTFNFLRKTWFNVGKILLTNKKYSLSRYQINWKHKGMDDYVTQFVWKLLISVNIVNVLVSLSGSPLQQN